MIRFHFKGNLSLDDYASVLTWYKKAATLEPSNAVYNDKVGDAYKNLKDYEAAAGWYEHAVRLDPTDSSYREHLRNAENNLHH